MKLNNSFRKKFRILFPIISTFILTLFFQNCGQDTFQARLPNSIEQDSNDQLDLSGIQSTVTISKKIYYVATNGSDSNSGTNTKPWKTISYAVSKMVAGDTTYVRGGLYKEKLIRFNKSGTATAPIKLLNAPGESPVIDFGVNAINRLVHRFEIDATGPTTIPIGWITIEGFKIGYGYEGIKFISAHNITIRRNWIHNSIGQGILGTGKNILIDRNVIRNAGNSHLDHGMYLTGSNYVITNNLVYGSSSHGIQVAGYLWEGSVHYKPKKGTVPDRSYAGASNFLIANNTLAYNGSAAIVIWQAEAMNNRVVNNIFYENGVLSKSGTSGANGINFLNSGKGNKIDNNLFYASGAGGTRMITNGVEGVHYTQTRNITANPNFVSAGATLSGVPNFRLKAGSPAIDKGLSLSQVTLDHAGGKRPLGKAIDIGAYEFGSSVQFQNLVTLHQ